MTLINNILRALLVLCLFTSHVFAQDGSNDSTFNTFDNGAFGTGTGFNSNVWASCLQADGKIIAGGIFSDYNGTAINGIARLNTDGSLDTTFNPGTGFDNYVYYVDVQTDGKIIAVGHFNSFNGTARSKIARLNADGSLDTSFDPGTGFDAWVNEVGIQSDGKIVVGGPFTSYNGATTNRLARLNTDGSLDLTFNIGTGFSGGVSTVEIQTDGKIIAGGLFTIFNGTSRNGIARLNTDGSLDATFDPGSGVDYVVFYTSLQSDGKVVIGGDFSSFNGIGRNCIARLNTDGSLDTTFNPGSGFNDRVDHLSIQGDGKIVVGGDFFTFNGTWISRIARLNADGSLDATFNPGTGFNSMVYPVKIQTDGKIIVGGTFTSFNGTSANYMTRLNADGTEDPFFNSGSGFSGLVFSTQIQTDEKIIVGGSFGSFNGVSRNRIARLNTDGSLNVSFDPGIGFNANVHTTNIQTDGKIIVGGQFTSFNGATRNRIARLNTDGSLDASFDPLSGFDNIVFCSAIQADGKIIVGGGFNSFGGISRNRIARLNADGSLDTTFNPGTGFVGVVMAISIQTDGKIIVGGGFNSFNGTTRNSIARLNADGSLDTNFDPGSGFNGQIRSTSIQADGKIIAAGGYDVFNGTTRNCIARLNTDGSLDLNFDPGTGFNLGLNSISIQSDEKIIAGGGFTSFNGTPINRIARIHPDGSLDTNFVPGMGFNASVRSTSLQADGKIIAGGDFTEFDGNPRNRIARLLNCIPPTVDSLSNVSICDGYALPALTVGNYYTAPSGSGIMLNVGDTITSTQTLYVYASNGTCTNENSFDVSIIPSPVEPANMTPTTVCPGSDVILSATGSGSGDILFFDATPTLIGTIAMPPGTATYNVGPLTAGSYTFGVAESNGICQSLPTEIIVNVSDVTAPVPDLTDLPPISELCEVTPTAPTSMDDCAGVVIGTTSTTFPITSNTIVTWSYDDGNGNTTTQLQTVIITGVDVSTTLGPDGTEITANNGNAASYQWVDCSTGAPVAAGTNQTYVATTNGSYAVIINEGGCIDISACVPVVSVGLDDLSTEFTIYPNPITGGSFTIKMDTKIAQIELIDLLGRLVKELKAIDDVHVVDVSDFETGKYFVKIITMDGRQLLAPIVIL